MQHNLTPIMPYRLDLTLDILRRFVTPLVDIPANDGSYWRALASPAGGLSLWRVDANFEAELIAQQGDIDLEAAQHDLAHILALDHDPRPFYAFAQTQPELWQVIAPIQGIRWLRTQTVFEALVALIIEQHIAWTAAQKSQKALILWANNKIHYQGRDYYAYPTPAQLAAATLEDLSDLKVTYKRKQLLIDLAGQISSGNFEIEALRNLPHAEAYQHLLALKGIGHWTAANVVMRALGGFPYVTDTDVALQAAANFYFNGVNGKLTPAGMRELFSRYGEFAGSAAYYTLLRWVLDRYPLNSDLAT